MKRLSTVSLIAAAVFCTNTVHAGHFESVRLTSSEYENPANGLTVSYEFGGKVMPTDRVSYIDFYLSDNQNTSTGIKLNRNSIPAFWQCSSQINEPCDPPTGSNMLRIESPGEMTAAAKEFLQSVEDACSPSQFYVIAGASNLAAIASTSASTFGTTKLPDFLFTGGSISTNSTATDGSVSINYSVRTPCPASGYSAVGVFLTDTSYQPLVYFGEVGVLGPLGSDHSLGLSFAGLGLAPGSYKIVLMADNNNRQQESNESNNYGVFSLTLTAPLSGSIKEQKLDSLTEDLEPQLRKRGTRDFIDPTPEMDYAPDFDHLGMEKSEGMVVIGGAGKE